MSDTAGILTGTILNDGSVASHQLRIAMAIGGGQYLHRVPHTRSRAVSMIPAADGLVDFGLPLKRPGEALLFLGDIGSGLMFGDPFCDAEIRTHTLRFAGVEPAENPSEAAAAFVTAGDLLLAGGGCFTRALGSTARSRMARWCLLDAVFFPIAWRVYRKAKLLELDLTQDRSRQAVIDWLAEVHTHKKITSTLRMSELIWFDNSWATDGQPGSDIYLDGDAGGDDV